MFLIYQQVQSFHHLYVKYLSKEQDIVNYSEITTFGMGVGNFMHTLSFENTMVKEQLLLYVNYLQFFHKSQEKYFISNFYFDAKIQKVNFFFKISHLNSGLLGYNYFAALHYPFADRYFKIGLKWTFVD